MSDAHDQYRAMIAREREGLRYNEARRSLGQRIADRLGAGAGISGADVYAARRLLGETDDVKTHPFIVGLPGEDKCVHRLYGNGGEVPGDVDDALDVFYVKQPYRHHQFTVGYDRSMCKCGNNQSNPIHTLCIGE